MIIRILIRAAVAASSEVVRLELLLPLQTSLISKGHGTLHAVHSVSVHEVQACCLADWHMQAQSFAASGLRLSGSFNVVVTAVIGWSMH